MMTLTLGWKNEKQPYGPVELDLEAGFNLEILKLLKPDQVLPVLIKIKDKV